MSTEKRRKMSANVEPRSERVAVRLSPSMKEAIERMAADDDVTVSKLLERLVRAEAEKRGKPN